MYHALPPAQRASAIVLGSNYGEAGAVDRFGRADGLPAAYGVQNGYWYWGPPPACGQPPRSPSGFDRAALAADCGTLRLAAGWTTTSAWPTTSRAHRSGSARRCARRGRRWPRLRDLG